MGLLFPFLLVISADVQYASLARAGRAAMAARRVNCAAIGPRSSIAS